jgi:hypothetical protein
MLHLTSRVYLRLANRPSAFLCHCSVVMDGQRKGGATAMVSGLTLTTTLQNFEVRFWDFDTGKMAHLHGDWAHVHRPCNKGGGGRAGGGVMAEAMQQPARTTRQQEGSTIRGNSLISRCDERPGGWRNERMRGQ